LVTYRGGTIVILFLQATNQVSVNGLRPTESDARLPIQIL